MFFSKFCQIINHHVEYLLNNGIDDKYLDILPDMLQDDNIPEWEKLYEAFLYLWLNNKRPKSKVALRTTYFQWNSVSKGFPEGKYFYIIKHSPLLFGNTIKLGSSASVTFSSIKEAYLAVLYAYYME